VAAVVHVMGVLMSRYAITIVASDDEVRLVQEAATEVEGVTTSDAQPLDDTAEALNFPIDPHSAMEALKLIGAFAETIAGIKQLLDAWSERRKKSREPTHKLPAQIMIADVNSGLILYTGPTLDATIAEKVIKAISESAGR
jgi:hypothetical protein